MFSGALEMIFLVEDYVFWDLGSLKNQCSVYEWGEKEKNASW